MGAGITVFGETDRSKHLVLAHLAGVLLERGAVARAQLVVPEPPDQRGVVVRFASRLAGIRRCLRGGKDEPVRDVPRFEFTLHVLAGARARVVVLAVRIGCGAVLPHLCAQGRTNAARLR